MKKAFLLGIIVFTSLGFFGRVIPKVHAQTADSATKADIEQQLEVLKASLIKADMDMGIIPPGDPDGITVSQPLGLQSSGAGTQTDGTGNGTGIGTGSGSGVTQETTHPSFTFATAAIAKVWGLMRNDWAVIAIIILIILIFVVAFWPQKKTGALLVENQNISVRMPMPPLSPQEQEQI